MRQAIVNNKGTKKEFQKTKYKQNMASLSTVTVLKLILFLVHFNISGVIHIFMNLIRKTGKASDISFSNVP